MSFARVALGLAVTLAGCAAGLPAPTELDARRVSERWPAVSTAQLEHGRVLYANRCARCHELYEPARFPAGTWETQVHEMQDRARLSESEERLILQYLVSVSSRSERRTAALSPDGH